MTPARRTYDPVMPPTGHKVSGECLEEFRRIYKEAHGEEITTSEAAEMAHRLLALYRLLMRPLPGETSTPVPSQQPPAQTAPEAF
jgi:hypothetical protein